MCVALAAWGIFARPPLPSKGVVSGKPMDFGGGTVLRCDAELDNVQSNGSSAALFFTELRPMRTSANPAVCFGGGSWRTSGLCVISTRRLSKDKRRTVLEMRLAVRWWGEPWRAFERRLFFFFSSTLHGFEEG